MSTKDDADVRLNYYASLVLAAPRSLIMTGLYEDGARAGLDVHNGMYMNTRSHRSGAAREAAEARREAKRTKSPR